MNGGADDDDADGNDDDVWSEFFRVADDDEDDDDGVGAAPYRFGRVLACENAGVVVVRLRRDTNAVEGSLVVDAALLLLAHEMSDNLLNVPRDADDLLTAPKLITDRRSILYIVYVVLETVISRECSERVEWRKLCGSRREGVVVVARFRLYFYIFTFGRLNPVTVDWREERLEDWSARQQLAFATILPAILHLSFYI